MSQYKYYMKKPRGEIAKDILFWCATSGAVAVAATSPFFLTNLLRAYLRSRQSSGNAISHKSASNAFYRLWRDDCFDIKKNNKQIYISLNERGRRKAGRFQINHLSIRKSKRWDGKWRLVIFDVVDTQRIKREALRGFLKRQGFCQLQKSIWAHPYDCRDEIDMLRDFFGFSSSELRLVVAQHVGDDRELQRFFGL